MREHKISIIIPTLNESVNIKRLLTHLLKNSTTDNISDIIVIDCGSDDDTQNIVTDFIKTNEQVQLLTSERGRAKQMNIGAKIASGDTLYFLHADSFPPSNFDQLIIDEVKQGNLAGCFKMKFDCNHWWLELAGC